MSCPRWCAICQKSDSLSATYRGASNRMRSPITKRQGLSRCSSVVRSRALRDLVRPSSSVLSSSILGVYTNLLTTYRPSASPPICIRNAARRYSIQNNTPSRQGHEHGRKGDAVKIGHTGELDANTSGIENQLHNLVGTTKVSAAHDFVRNHSTAHAIERRLLI